MRRAITIFAVFIFASSFMILEAKAQNPEAEKIKAEIRRHKQAIDELRVRLHSILGSPPKEAGYSESEGYHEEYYQGIPPEGLQPKERMKHKWDKPPKPEFGQEHRPRPGDKPEHRPHPSDKPGLYQEHQGRMDRPQDKPESGLKGRQLPGRRVGPDQEGPGKRIGPPDMPRGQKEEMRDPKDKKGGSPADVRSR